jgi:2-polyprenyl-6-methoxyphenol hydroxylase-like FAD-dependent oxidoreductase
VASLRKILIVGGGFSGLSAAIAFRKAGVGVTLVEIAADCGAYGAGISIGGATLRALGQLGVLDEYFRHGFGCEATEMRDPHDSLIRMIPAPRLAGADVPGNGAVMRPALARILHDAAVAAGADVRLLTTVEDIRDSGDKVHARLSDGTLGDHDLVIGADGLHSQLRALLFPDAPRPAYNGQSVWRAVLPKLAGVNHTMLWIGATTKVGLNPVSADEMYVFVNENRPTRDRIAEADLADGLRALLEPYDAPLVQAARDLVGPDSRIVFRPLDGLLMPLPWHRGRIVLIGDAVHATTPHLASGAGIGIEDAIVLAQECMSRHDLDEALQAFGARRWERCRMVVHNSGRLGEIEVADGDKAEHAQLMQESFRLLAEAI